MAAATFARRIGTAIKETAIGNRTSGGWYDPHMAAASRAVAERIPLVDFVLEVRDARVCLLLLLFIRSHCMLFDLASGRHVFVEMSVPIEFTF